MTFIHDTVIREYLSGKIIQLYLEDKWLDLANRSLSTAQQSCRRPYGWGDR